VSLVTDTYNSIELPWEENVLRNENWHTTKEFEVQVKPFIPGDLVKTLRLVARIAKSKIDPDKTLDRNKVLEEIRNAMNEAGISAYNPKVFETLAPRIWAEMSKFGTLFYYLTDPETENIDIDSPKIMRVQISGGASFGVLDPRFGFSPETTVDRIRLLLTEEYCTTPGERIDVSKPAVDVELKIGARLSANYQISRYPVISIRRHGLSDVVLKDLVERQTIPEVAAEFLACAVREKQNILVAGPMGSGKTTLLRALCGEIPPHEHIATVEDTYELKLHGERHPFCIEYTTREAGIAEESKLEITARDLARFALRKNLSRLIVGEVRGDEILAMLNAMTQGQSGSMCTIHAESARGAFDRIAQYCLQAPERLKPEDSNYLAAHAVNFVIYIQPVYAREEFSSEPPTLEGHKDLDVTKLSGATKFSRMVTSIIEVVGYIQNQGTVQTNEIFAWDQNKGMLMFKPASCTETTKKILALAGFRWDYWSKSEFSDKGLF
jgi:Flp pilus assembly CpaF family ATPase